MCSIETVRNTYNFWVIHLLGGCFNEKWQLFGTTAIGASLLLGACGGGGNADSGKGEGEVKGDGSSTVGPIIEKLNEKFAKDNKDVTVSSGTSGTGGGFEKFISGSTDFSNASRPIKDEEKKNWMTKVLNTMNSKLLKTV